MVWRLLAERRAETEETAETAETAWPAARASALRWGAFGLVAGLVCWAAPLYEQIAHKGGNLTFVLEAVQAGRTRSSYSLPAAARRFASIIGLPPWWLPPSMHAPAVAPGEQGVSLPGSLLILGTLALLLVLATWRAHRRANHTLTSGLTISTVGVGLTIFTMANARSTSG